MDKGKWCLVSYAGGVVASFVVFVLILLPGAERDGYRAGQIDAARGVMKYELVKQDDGTTSWELIDE